MHLSSFLVQQKEYYWHFRFTHFGFISIQIKRFEYSMSDCLTAHVSCPVRLHYMFPNHSICFGEANVIITSRNNGKTTKGTTQVINWNWLQGLILRFKAILCCYIHQWKQVGWSRTKKTKDAIPLQLNSGSIFTACKRLEALAYMHLPSSEGAAVELQRADLGMRKSARLEGPGWGWTGFGAADVPLRPE